jgi:hypothetical protein
MYSVKPVQRDINLEEQEHAINVLKIVHNYSPPDQYEARLASRRQLTLQTWEAK